MCIKILKIEIIVLFLKCFVACTPLIPIESQQFYILENKVSVKHLHHDSKHDTSYNFNSVLKMNSVWNNEKEQLLEVYFTENYVTATDNKGRERALLIDKIPDRPFYISFIDNKPTKIIAHTSRDQSLLNIKRAIASLMHINFEGGPVSEVDISGVCNNFYNIKSSTKVTKIKTECSHWDLKVNYRSEKPLGIHQNSMETVEYDLSADGQLLIASSVETHKVNLEAHPEVGSHVQSLFVLKHKTFSSEPVKQIPHNSSDDVIKSLLDWYKVFEIEADVDGSISELKDVSLEKQIAASANYLKDDMVGSEALAETFVKLVPLARITKEIEFENILKSNKEVHYQLVDLMGAAQTIDAFNAINKYFNYNEKSHQDILEKYFQSLSVGTHPERPIIENLFEILSSTEGGVQNKKLEESMLQCVVALTRQSGFDPNDSLFKNISEFILNKLLNECEESLCKTRHIRALQNLQDPSTIPVLINCVSEEEPQTSVAAMEALKAFQTIYFNEKHRQDFTNIFFQLQKKYDSSARIIALDILLKMKPTVQQLGHLVDYLASTDHHFEIKTYVIQKLQMLSKKCPRFRALLALTLFERPHVNNYHILGQKGLSTVLSRELSTSPAFNESLLSVQEIYKGILKRGFVEFILFAEKEEISTFKLGIYTSGLSSLIGDGDDDSIVDEEENNDGPATAGMEITVQGILLRPLVFFSGQSELMGHVWSGTASDPTPAFQATNLLHDHEHYIILASGSTVYMRTLAANTVDLSGKVGFSIWNRNANTEINHNTAATVHGITKAGFTFAYVSNEFLLSYAPKLSLQADIDFYSGIKLCIQLQRPEMQFKHVNTRTVSLQTGTNFTKRVSSKCTFKFPGHTLALNQKNNEMCSMIFN